MCDLDSNPVRLRTAHYFLTCGSWIGDQSFPLDNWHIVFSLLWFQLNIWLTYIHILTDLFLSYDRQKHILLNLIQNVGEWRPPPQTPSTTTRAFHSATTTVTPSSIASESQSSQRSATVGNIHTLHHLFWTHGNSNTLHALLPSIYPWGMPLAMFSAFPISSGLRLPMPTLPWRIIPCWPRRPYGWNTSATRPLPLYF